MARESITVVDNRTGRRAELPILEGTMGQPTVDINPLSTELGYLSFDPGFVSTGSCKSAITYIDGDAGILLHRGYPIEQLAERSTFVDVPYCWRAVILLAMTINSSIKQSRVRC